MQQAIAIGLAALPAVALAMRFALEGPGANPIEDITHLTGEWALRLVLVSLAITPLRRFARFKGLAPLRRTFGLAGFTYACLHVLTWAILDHGLAFEAILEDVAASLRAHGFENIVLIGDSGGNQRGQQTVADLLNERWGEAIVHHIGEFYNYGDVEAYMENDLGVEQPVDDGLHDNFYITSIMMTVDPTVARYDQRVAAGKTTINGVSIAPKEEAIAVGEQLMRFRVEATVAAINAAIAAAQAPPEAPPAR